MARILLTGITGYLGSHLAQALLAQQHEIYALVRQPLNHTYLSGIEGRLQLCWYDGSFDSLLEAVQQSRPELVYHMAAYYTGGHGETETPKLIDSNIVLGGGLLEAMALCGGGKLVYPTSVMCHYRGELFCPLNLYAATKKAFSDLLSYYVDAGLLQAAEVTLSDTYGPDDRRPKVLNLVKQAVRTGRSLPLSAGEQDYDAVYVDDIVSGLIAAGASLAQKDIINPHFQLGSAQVHTLRETIELFLMVNGLSFQGQWGARPQEPRAQACTVRLFPAPPGWIPQVPLQEGLRRFWEEDEGAWQ